MIIVALATAMTVAMLIATAFALHRESTNPAEPAAADVWKKFPLT